MIREFGRADSSIAIRAIRVHGLIPWRCSRCEFNRRYETEQGLMRGVSEHLLQTHNVRAVWPGLERDA